MSFCEDKKCKGYGKRLVESNFGMVCPTEIGNFAFRDGEYTKIIKLN